MDRDDIPSGDQSLSTTTINTSNITSCLLDPRDNLIAQERSSSRDAHVGEISNGAHLSEMFLKHLEQVKQEDEVLREAFVHTMSARSVSFSEFDELNEKGRQQKQTKEAKTSTVLIQTPGQEAVIALNIVENMEKQDNGGNTNTSDNTVTQEEALKDVATSDAPHSYEIGNSHPDNKKRYKNQTKPSAHSSDGDSLVTGQKHIGDFYSMSKAEDDHRIMPFGVFDGDDVEPSSFRIFNPKKIIEFMQREQQSKLGHNASDSNTFSPISNEKVEKPVSLIKATRGIQLDEEKELQAALTVEERNQQDQNRDKNDEDDMKPILAYDYEGRPTDSPRSKLLSTQNSRDKSTTSTIVEETFSTDENIEHHEVMTKDTSLLNIDHTNGPDLDVEKSIRSLNSDHNEYTTVEDYYKNKRECTKGLKKVVMRKDETTFEIIQRKYSTLSKKVRNSGKLKLRSRSNSRDHSASETISDSGLEPHRWRSNLAEMLLRKKESS